MTGNIMAIDPGNRYSAYVIMDAATLKPLEFGKLENEKLRGIMLNAQPAYPWGAVVIERVQSYGMAVGREVFETCEWTGRYTEQAVMTGHSVFYIDRIEEKQYICHDSRAKDSNVRRALIDRFAKHDFKNGKGSKQNPDFFWGFHADVWAAYAVGLTFMLKAHDKALQEAQT